MKNLFPVQFTFYLISVPFCIWSETNASSTVETPPKFSEEFGQFINNLGSMVYRRRLDDVYPKTTEDNKFSSGHKNNLIPKLEREAVHDVLMMKLVSYYEDKYKLTPTYKPNKIAPFTDDDIFTSRRPIYRNYYQQRIPASPPDSIAEVFVL